MKQITALFALLFCASLAFGQTIEKSQSIMIYDIKPTVAPCTFCSERAFVRADNTEYWWNGSAWVKWYDGNSYLTALVQDSIIVTTRFGVEVDRDTVRVSGGGGGGSGTVETIVAGTGISVNATDPANPIVTNTGIITEVDGSITNEGRLGVGAGISTSATITTNTSGSNPVSLEVGTGLSISEVPGTNGGIITFANTAPDQTVALTGSKLASVTGTYPSFNVKAEVGAFLVNSDTTSITTTKPTRITGSGAIVIRTGITINSTYQEPVIKILYSTGGEAASLLRTNGEFVFTCRVVAGVISRAYFHLDGNWYFDKIVRYAVESGRLVLILGTDSQGAISMSVNMEAQSYAPLVFNSANFSVTKSTNTTALSPVTVEGISPEFLPGVQMTSSDAAAYTAFTLVNTVNGSIFPGGVRINMIPNNNVTPTGSGTLQSKGVSIAARESITNNIGLGFSTPATAASDPTERFFINHLGNIGISQATPSYLLDLGGTTAAARFTPHNTALTGIEGLFFAHDASNHFKGHDGTSLYRFAKFSDVTSTDGQMPVYDSASDRWVPSTVATLLETQTNYQVDISDNPAGTNFRTVYGGDSEAAIGVTQDGADAAIVELSVYNNSSGAASTVTLSESEALIEGAIARVKGTDVVINSNLSDITMLAVGSGFKQTGFVVDDTSAIRVVATTAPNFAGIQYPSGAVRVKFTDLSLTDKGYVDNLFAQGFQGSIVLPDSLVSILTSDGAGIEFFSDYVNLVGTEVMVNDQVIPMQDTLVIPIYCQPHGEAAATGNDYRGWRVPPDLDGARLIGVHYSFDTPGSDTALIQLGNGAVNVFGGTIPATGFVNVTASRVLVANEKWTPSIGTLNGTGHEGLMLNLIIERNR